MPVLLAGRGTGEDFRRHQQQQRGVPSSDEHYTPSETAPSEISSQHRPGMSDQEENRAISQGTRADDVEEDERIRNMLLELEIMEESEQEEFLRSISQDDRVRIEHAIRLIGRAKDEVPDEVISEQERISELVRERHALQEEWAELERVQGEFVGQYGIQDEEIAQELLDLQEEIAQVDSELGLSGDTPREGGWAGGDRGGDGHTGSGGFSSALVKTLNLPGFAWLACGIGFRGEVYGLRVRV